MADINDEIKRLENEMNIAGMLAEIDGATKGLWNKIRHKDREIKKLKERLQHAEKGQNLPEVTRMLNKKENELEKEADEIRAKIKKLYDRRQEIIKQQSL
jgi:uncharacterized coiled-coil DUF342 family protein